MGVAVIAGSKCVRENISFFETATVSSAININRRVTHAAKHPTFSISATRQPPRISRVLATFHGHISVHQSSFIAQKYQRKEIMNPEP